MTKILFRIYVLFNILSLDVAAGAVLTSAAICRYAGITLVATDFFLLGNAVWIIYTLDHLYDAIQSYVRAYSRRRDFHIRYRKPLQYILLIAVIAEIVVLMLKGFHLLLPAIPAFGITFLYLLFNWISQRRAKKFYVKEIMIAAGYTCGILAIPASYLVSRDGLYRLYIFQGIFLFLTALANVLVIGWYETDVDRREQQVSVAGWINRGVLGGIIWAVIALQLLAAWTFLPCIGFCMAVCMVILFAFPRYFAKNERYRMLADGVFLIPGLFLIYRIFC